MTNMVLVGALLANLNILPLSALEKSLKEHLPKKHHKLLPANKLALEKGGSYVTILEK